MDNLEKIERLLKSMSYRAASLSRAAVKRGQEPFVTISRQAGAGGHKMAEALLKEFDANRENPLFQGWHIADDAILSAIAKNPSLKVSLRELLDEDYHSAIQDVIYGLVGLYSPQSHVMIEISTCIRTLATFGKVIIVGRGGVCLTRELPTGVHVRLVAALPSRMRHTMDTLQISDREARRIVEERDTARAKMISTYFNQDIDDPLLYDVTWNTDSVPMQDIARAVMGLVASRTRDRALPPEPRTQPSPPDDMDEM